MQVQTAGRVSTESSESGFKQMNRHPLFARDGLHRPSSALYDGPGIFLSQELVGLTVHKSPAQWGEPTVPFGIIRTHDWGGKASWRRVEQSTTIAGRGNYDWADLDWLAAYCAANDRTILFTLMSTPTWAARPEYQNVSDNYGYKGGGSPPADMSWAAEFVTAVVSRYNAVSPVNPTGRKNISIVEVWNEPTLFMESLKGAAPQWSDLASLTRVVNQAAKYVDPSIRVINGGLLTGSFGAIHSFINASDGAGGKGGDWIDELGMHFYGMMFSESYGDQQKSFVTMLRKVRAVLVSAGYPDMPIANTEMGWQPIYFPTVQFHKFSRSDQRKMLRKMLVVSAAFGVTTNIVYDWDGSSIGGGIFPLIESAEFAAALSDVWGLVGKTMTYCGIATNGDVVVVADGAEFRL